ncbi:FtsK/SpoIIIE family DNA translocase [Dethiobacter alkaliphilus]|uniref:FtsK/SpoIIIE family DNA translocase n=1 Tax=Dethiobacter alkaliphilus TaxID=427926 RepID=UPI00222630BF|nr:DNA translocase FtsK [Dethiobacter alkaliphilus]MCW3490811.1 DNA translocase FtsK [Dethiobacter alkaliphilus]
MATFDMSDEIRYQVKAIFKLALAALAFAAILFPGQTGEVGSFFNNVLRLFTGDLAILIPIVLAMYGLQGILPWKIPNIKQRMAGLTLFFLVILIYAHMELMTAELPLVTDQGMYGASWQLGVQQQGGGVIGAMLAIMLYFLFRDYGSYIILTAMTVISFLLVTNISITQLLGTAGRAMGFCVRGTGRGLKSVGSFFRFIFASSAELEVEEAAGEEAEESDKNRDDSTEDTLFTGDEDKPQHTFEPALAPVIPFPQKDAESDLSDTIVENKPVNTKDDPLVVDTKDEGEAISFVPAQGDYTVPSLSLLSKIPKHKDNQQKKTIADRAKVLEKTLDSFGVKVRVTDAQTGPTVTRFEIQPETGVKISKIVALADDLALNLAAADVRIEAPIPGKAAVGIEVPNKVIAPVYLREVLEDEQFKNAGSALTIGLGKDITGNAILADLKKMPHLLIAGSTGSGKSVCINALISSILFKARPDEVKFVMIDPKVVELNTFNGIPHLLMPVVTEPKKASMALKNMLKEMSRRYEMFAQESVRDIAGYNERKCRENKEDALLPYIVVIIDELADLMMVAAADVEDSIARLAQMSRAAGIHLVIATQRPSVDVITGVIKANITSRIAFAVSSQVDSRTILDMGGAEKLLGRGDALFHPIGAPKPYRIQGAFINERELNSLLEFIKKQGEPQFVEQLMPDEEEEDEDIYEEDELFADAVMLVAEAETASISLLQRRLRIGYTRAARLIDDMERRGFVGRFEGSKAREVLITPDLVQKLLYDKESEASE